MGESVANKWWFTDKQILLVEDNDLVHDLVRAIMERVGIDIDICLNGAEAVVAVQNKAYDVVLMDIQMPIMDGLEATRRIRQLGGDMQELPIIAMSANSHPEDVEMGHKAGMNAHLGKPIDKELLYKTLSRYLDTGIAEKPDAASANESLAIEFPTLSHIDTREGLDRIAGNVRAYSLMLKNFRQKYLSAGSEMESYLRQGDIDAAARLAHNIKGNAGNLGASALHRYATEMELTCKQLDTDMLLELLPGLETELGSVIRNIETVADKSISTQIPDREFDPAIWSRKSYDFIALLNSDFGAAMDALQELITTAADRYSEEMLLLEKYMDEFDAISARSILEKINKNAGYA